MATRYLRAVAAVAALLAASSVCATPELRRSSDLTSPTPAGATVPCALLTHCGIHELRLHDTFFVADRPLDDGNGNAPVGWDRPYQQGTITLEASTVVFRDNRGHTVTFHERLGATDFLRTCS